MQDRFKYRFWHKPTKKIVDCYGFNKDFVFGDVLDGIGTTYNPAIFDDCILMQCTGLKDKNGKLIYEGDIIKFGEFYDNKWNSFDIGKVYWGGKFDYPAFELQCSTADFDMSNGLSYIFGNGLNIEVIGNIYEYPELLED